MIENNNICAVFTAYNPDEDFEKRVDIIANQVKYTIIVDNSPCPRKIVFQNNNIEIIQNQSNPGVATAINDAIRLAVIKGFTWVLTFDQDTIANNDLVEKIITAANSVGNIDNIAIIGSNFISKLNNEPAFTLDANSSKFVEFDTVITSGSLVNLDIYNKIGPLREDFFIDHIDDEYCFRARINGYKIYITTEPLMKHVICAPVQRKFLWRYMYSMNAPDFRYYYMVRNCIVVIKLYSKSEPKWAEMAKITVTKRVMAAVLTESGKLKKIYIVLKAILDAYLKRMGKRIIP